MQSTRKRPQKLLIWANMNVRNCAHCSTAVTSCASAEVETDPRRSRAANEKKSCDCWKVCAHENSNSSRLSGLLVGHCHVINGGARGTVCQSQSGIRRRRF